MDEEQSQTSSVNFEFINVTGGSGRERRRNNYLARAHAAKINRQNYKTQSSSRRSKHATTFSILPKRSTTIASGTDEDTESENGRVRSQRATATNSSGDELSIYNADTLPSPQSISPIFGAIAIDTFDWTSQPMSARIGHYLLKVSWPARSGTEVTRAWWREFCTCQIIYHVGHLASAVHRDLMVGESSWALSPEVLLHKTQTIRLINDQLASLSSLTSKAIDELIFAVTTLARHETDQKHFQAGEVLLFTPHMPHANGMNPLGRLNWSASARTLLVQLVHSQGGLDKLQIPGLGEMLALIDILESSTDMSKPRFCPFWGDYEAVDLEGFAGIGHVSPGRGFSSSARILPEQAATALRDLAHADMFTAYYDLVPLDKDYSTVLYVRNSAIHAVLSLPPWNELSMADDCEVDLALYEACRVTSIMYSNAVLLGLPTHSGWHQSFVGKLRNTLESTDLSSWAETVPELLIWILFIGGIASYRTLHRRFFEISLRDILHMTGVLSWSSVKQCLEQFLWSQSACELGAAVIWDALDLEGSWRS